MEGKFCMVSLRDDADSLKDQKVQDGTKKESYGKRNFGR